MTEPEKRVFADFDEDGIWVYQAFRVSTVAEAVRRQKFGKGFSLDRMTWIKPSLGWMLHRSEYATKRRQEAIARIKLSHEGFVQILQQGIPTSFDPTLFDSETVWGMALTRSDVRYQWDPDRDLQGFKRQRRAIQLGIRGRTVEQYVEEWVRGIEDITALAPKIGEAVKHRVKDVPVVPEEREFPLAPKLKHLLGYDQ